MRVKPNDLVGNGPGSTYLENTARVLVLSDSSKQCWLIYLPALKKEAGKEQQVQDYVKAPFTIETDKFYEHLSSGAIVVLNTRPAVALSDADRLAEARACGKEQSVIRDIQKRDKRFAVIRCLVFEKGSNVLRNIEDLLSDPALPQKIVEAAQHHASSEKSVRHFLNLFLAGGSVKGALSTRYPFCGNPGQPKSQSRHLGRKPNLYKQGLIESDGYVLTDQCKKKIAQGFRLIKHGTTEHDAYITTMSAHWADHHINERTGEVRPMLFVSHQRPTFDQFIRWGRKLNDTTTTAVLLGVVKHRQSTDARGGSEQDLVIALCQLASFDATSTDVYLTRLISRLKKLPPMTRMILKEARLGMIYGVYCGWEPPSPATALQTILHGASPHKQAWAKRFGVDMPADAMPVMLARAHLVDNGELKGAKPTEAEEQFGFGVDIAPAMRGDRKGGIEAEHHSQHKHVDHKLPGSTRGKRPERGDVLPVTEGLFNYFEYMRELIEFIVWRNTVEEVPDLAPDDFLLQDPPISPTRLNIYRWLTERGMNQSLPVDHEALRAFCLPDCDAVIRKNGIYLEAKIHGRKQLVPRLRFTSDELVATGLLSKVKQTGSPIHTRVKLDQQDLSTAWLPTKAGLIRLTSSVRDTTIHQKLSLTEWVATAEETMTRKALASGDSDQHDADVLVRRASVHDNAKAELALEIKAKDKPPSRAEMKRNLRGNRADEIEFLNRMEQASALPPPSPTAQTEAETPTLTPAELVMESLQQAGLLP